MSVSEIQSLTEDIAQASSAGAIVRFFNSADDAKSLKKHTSYLDEIIRGATVSLLAQLMTVAAAHNGQSCSKLSISVDTNRRVKVRGALFSIISYLNIDVSCSCFTTSPSLQVISPYPKASRISH
jgi:hypothetical protein